MNGCPSFTGRVVNGAGDCLGPLAVTAIVGAGPLKDFAFVEHLVAAYADPASLSNQLRQRHLSGHAAASTMHCNLDRVPGIAAALGYGSRLVGRPLTGSLEMSVAPFEHSSDVEG